VGEVAQEYSGVRVLHVRTALSPEALAPMVEREIHAIEPELPLYDVQSMTQALNSGYGLFAVRTGAFFAAILALLGLSLAVVGLYAMVSYMTSERTHEIGVRIALGANTRHIAAMVIREGARLTVAGTALGVAGALALARVLSRLLFGVAPTDPASFAVAAGCVLIVILLATYRPARRAARVDPVVALRAE